MVPETKVSLSALVRRWMAVSDDLKHQDRRGQSPGEPDVTLAPPPDPALVAPESTVEYPDEGPLVETEGDVDGTDPEGVARIALPRRRRGRTQPQLARRPAVLIDARAVTTESTDQVLNAAGVAVMAFGPADSPEDVRGMCEFTDLELLDPGPAATGDRHRA